MQRPALYPFVLQGHRVKPPLLLSPPPSLSANCASPSLLARHGGTGMQTAPIMTFTVYSLLRGGSPALQLRNAERRLNGAASEAAKLRGTLIKCYRFTLYMQVCVPAANRGEGVKQPPREGFHET